MSPFKHLDDRKERKTSRNFAAPTRDQMSTGYFMTPGDDHGVGFTQPVGTEKVTKKSVIPMESKCFSSSDVI